MTPEVVSAIQAEDWVEWSVVVFFGGKDDELIPSQVLEREGCSASRLNDPKPQPIKRVLVLGRVMISEHGSPEPDLSEPCLHVSHVL